jgi:hypothetical protein
MNDIMLMCREQAVEFQKAYRKIVWDRMMSGDALGWKAYFEMIETGESKAILAENVRYPI